MEYLSCYESFKTASTGIGGDAVRLLQLHLDEHVQPILQLCRSLLTPHQLTQYT